MNYTWIKLFWNEEKVTLYFHCPLRLIQVFIMESLNVYRSREFIDPGGAMGSFENTNVGPILLSTPHISVLKPQFILKQISGITSIHLHASQDVHLKGRIL